MKHLATLALLFACGQDATEPLIEFSDLRVEEISSERAVVRFDTSIETSCEVQFGFDATTMNEIATDPEMEEGEMAFEHQVPLEDLRGATEYFLRAVATDERDRTAYSEVISFSTLPGPGDDPSAGMTNVASRDQGAAVADKSSNWADGDDDSSFGAGNAIDDSMATEWSSNLDGNDAYLVIDLGQERSLSYVGYRSRKMADGSSIVQSFELIIKGNVYGPYATPDPDQRYVFALTPSITTDEVRWQVATSSGGNTGAKEIQLY